MTSSDHISQNTNDMINEFIADLCDGFCCLINNLSDQYDNEWLVTKYPCDIQIFVSVSHLSILVINHMTKRTVSLANQY